MDTNIVTMLVSWNTNTGGSVHGHYTTSGSVPWNTNTGGSVPWNTNTGGSVPWNTNTDDVSVHGTLTLVVVFQEH